MQESLSAGTEIWIGTMRAISGEREIWNDDYVDSSCDFCGCHRMSRTVTQNGGNGCHPLSRLGSRNIFVGDFVAHPSKTPRTRVSVVVSSVVGTDCQRTGIGTQTGTLTGTGNRTVGPSHHRRDGPMTLAVDLPARRTPVRPFDTLDADWAAL